MTSENQYGFTADATPDAVEDALVALRRGEMVLVVDDEDRENEGDLIMAAEHVTPSAVAFMVRHTTGLLCVAIPDERADELDLPLMVTRATTRRAPRSPSRSTSARASPLASRPSTGRPQSPRWQIQPPSPQT